MGRISRHVAEDMARAMLADKKKALDKQRKELEVLAHELIQRVIPSLVLEAYKEAPKYFNQYGYVNVTGNGFNNQRFSLSKSLPLASSYVTLKPNDSAILLEAHDNFTDADKAYDNLFLEVRTALTNLGTYNKIRDAFPEAEAFIPPSITREVAVNITDLRKKLTLA